MGACEIYETVVAGSAREGYDRLVEEAVNMYGEDSYNGTISTTYGYTMKKFDMPKTKKAEKELNAFIKKCYEKCGKRDAICIDLGVVSYERIKLVKKTKKSSATFRQMYVLKIRKGFNDFRIEKTAEKKSDLDKHIMTYLKKGYEVCIAKEPVNVNHGNTELATYSRAFEFFKRKPKATKDTLEIREMHKYIFVGWAAE